MALTAAELSQQAISNINALQSLAEANPSTPADIQAQLDAYAAQVEDLQNQLESQGGTSELYRNEILNSSEFLGFAIEILTKIQGLLTSKVIITMPVDDQQQLEETLLYISDCHRDDEARRKDTDPRPRTFAEFRNP